MWLVLGALVVGGGSSDEASVAAIRTRAACGAPATVICSATLVSPRAALTAAHCVEDPVGLLELVTAADATDPDAAAVRIADAQVVPGVDLAIVTLTEAWPGAVLPLGALPGDALGRAAEVIGYGDDGAGGGGVRRAGTATIDAVAADVLVLVPGPALTCGGDSGGPVVLDGAVVAVTSYGDPDCTSTTTAVRVDVSRAFLDDAVMTAATAPTGVPGPGTPDCADDSGCRVGGGASGGGALLLLLALVAACGRTRRAEGPCGDGVQHGGPPPGERMMWCADAEGAKHGPMREWWPDGTPKLDATYQHGKQHGRFTRWYEDGTKQEEGELADGLRIGRWTEWYEDGTLKREADHDGDAVRWTLYREDDGTRWIEGRFAHQREHGHFVEYYPDGAKLAEGEFVDGAKTGAWSYWNPDGSVSLEELGSYAPGAFAE